MRKRLLFVISTFLLVCNSGMAANINQNANLSKWVSAYWKLCKGHNIGNDNPCIGESRGRCTAKSWVTPRYGDEYGISMMVAVESTQGGAKFCPISIVGRNTNKKDAWTEYYSAGDNCVWLCRKGFTGDHCSTAVADASTCDSSKLLQSNYDSIKKTDGKTKANIEDNIAMWGANYYHGCGLNKGQEHDLIFAISNWLPNGHGAKVRPYMVRAERSGWADMISWIDIYPASSIQNNDSSTSGEMVGCKDGYQSNGSDCVVIREALCRDIKYCSGWDSKNYDSTKHTETIVNGCYQYRCKKTGEGFADASSKTCGSCGDTMLDGVNPSTGVCVHCKTGKVFSASASKTGYCADTLYVDKNMLLYGSGSQSDNIDAQCWTMIDVNKYKKCVLKKYNY